MTSYQLRLGEEFTLGDPLTKMERYFKSKKEYLPIKNVLGELSADQS